MRNKTLVKTPKYRIVKQRKRHSDKVKFVVMRRIFIDKNEQPFWSSRMVTPEFVDTGREVKVATFKTKEEAEHYLTIGMLKGEL